MSTWSLYLRSSGETLWSGVTAPNIKQLSQILSGIPNSRFDIDDVIQGTSYLRSLDNPKFASICRHSFLSLFFSTYSLYEIKTTTTHKSM
jgi:hypothetical protein